MWIAINRLILFSLIIVFIIGLLTNNYEFSLLIIAFVLAVYSTVNALAILLFKKNFFPEYKSDKYERFYPYKPIKWSRKTAINYLFLGIGTIVFFVGLFTNIFGFVIFGARNDAGIAFGIWFIGIIFNILVSRGIIKISEPPQ